MTRRVVYRWTVSIIWGRDEDHVSLGKRVVHRLLQTFNETTFEYTCPGNCLL
jgi:hypothetical protein